jgi:hypothetical protein
VLSSNKYYLVLYSSELRTLSSAIYNIHNKTIVGRAFALPTDYPASFVICPLSFVLCLKLMTNDPSGSPVAHGGNPQDRTGSPMTND